MPATVSQNRLLAALPEADRQSLVSQAETVVLRSLEELYPADGYVESVYFPLTMVASTLIGAGHDDEVEIATIGNEGMLGSSVILGTLRAFGRTLVHMHGMALKLSAELLHTHMERQPVLWTILARYLDVLTRQIAQTCACNHLHDMEERCARWLLLTQDRVGQNAFMLTQQYLSEVMGVRRATVNRVLGMFKRTGLIAYVRGRVQILERASLEAISCPCYAIIVAEYQRLHAEQSAS
jgi:hypothetical protein